MKVKADSSQVGPGLKGMTDGLAKVQKGAEQTEAAVKDIGKTPVVLTIRDEAIAKSRARIRDLQDEIAKAKTLDINADTTAAQREIAKLRGGIKTLEGSSVDVPIDADITGAETGIAKTKAGLRGLAGTKTEVTIDADTTAATSKMGALKASLSGLGGAAKEAAGGGGMGGLTTAVTAFLPPQAKAIALIAGAGVALGNMAADVETAKLQFQGITGSAEAANKVFNDIRDFAASTPFEFPELAQAGKTLLAFGVDADDVIKNLRNLGEAAAATGVPIGDVALIYGQMLAKGKVANEELLQLGERGIGATDILAKKLGLTTAEVQDLATAGKLGRKEIELLGEGIGEAFGGSLALQAESFNGQMSNLSDTFHTMGSDLGTLFLPAMKDLLSFVNTNVGALGNLVHGISDWDKSSQEAVETSDEWWGGLLRNVFAIEKVDKATGDAAKSTDDLKDAQKKATANAEALKVGQEKMARAAQESKEQIDYLNTALDKQKQKLEDAKGALQDYYDQLGQGGADQDAFTRSLISLGDSVKENGKKFEGNSVQALNNRDALRDVAGRAGELVGALAAQGASVDVQKQKMGELRTQFINTATSMGIPKKAAEELATQYGLVPDNISTAVAVTGLAKAEADVARLQAELDALKTKQTIELRWKFTQVSGDAPPGPYSSGYVFPRAAPSAFGVPPSPEVSAYQSRMASANLAAPAPRAAAAPMAVPVKGPLPVMYTINVNVERGAPTAEVGRSIVDQIRAFERAAGRSWRNG
jgi:tape measure domain-containing protein